MSIESKFVYEYSFFTSYDVLGGNADNLWPARNKVLACAGFVTQMHFHTEDIGGVPRVSGVAVSGSIDGINQTIENLKQLQQG